MASPTYIHGTAPDEQERLTGLNTLTNAPFLDFLAVTPSSTVLEVGSGLGILAEEIARRVPNGEVWGIEFSAEQLARANHGVRNLKFIQGDAHQLPFEDHRFDVVYCRYLLEHVTDPLQVLREMYRVLKPGGEAFVQENNILINTFDPDCPAFDFVWGRFAMLQSQLGGDAQIGKKLFSLFHRAGFDEIALSVAPEIHHSGQPTFEAWIENLIGNVRSGEVALVAHGLCTHEEIRKAIAELHTLLEREDATALFYWNRARGMKN